MRLDLSLDDVPDHDRLERWSEAIFDTLAITVRPLPDATGPFRASFTARSSGPLLNCRFDSDGFHATRQSREIAHRHWDGYRIYRESSAGVWFRIGGQEMVSCMGDLVIADADVPFEARPVQRYADESWLVPKALLDPHLPSLAKPLMARLSGHSGVDGLAAGYLESLTRNWDSIPEASMGAVTDTLARLVAIACGTAAGAHGDAVQSGRLAQARRYIDRHLADAALSPVTVAAALGIAVRTLHELFEPTGSSFTRHVQRQRLEQCRAALIGNPARAVTDIAFAWGFNSLSTFHRNFQAAFGMSPGDLRAASGNRYRTDAAT